MAARSKKAAPKPTGRPSLYTEELGALICLRLADGEGLVGICRDDDMPHRVTVHQWLLSTDERFAGFHNRYVRARDMQADKFAEEILQIADDASGDVKAGLETVSMDAEFVARSRLRVDSRKWLASKLAPKKYGDKVQAELSGPDGGAIQVDSIVRRIVRPRDQDS